MKRQLTQRDQAAAKTKLGLTQRRRGTRRNAEKINRIVIVSGISNLVKVYPFAFAGGMFVLSTVLFSQAATVALMMPIGQAPGIPTSLLVAFYPASNGLFFVPTYGTVLAAVSFDQTGTTKIGKYLLNHSFM